MSVGEVVSSLVLTRGIVGRCSTLFLAHIQDAGYMLHLVADCALATRSGWRMTLQIDFLFEKLDMTIGY